jgi:hypothetical protein
MPIKLNCVICNNEFWVRPSRIKNGAKYCCYTCHQIGEGRKGGEAAGKLQKKKSKGLSYIKDKNRHLHRTIAEYKIGRKLEKGEIVHHIDGNKFNNSPENLEVITQSEHINKHRESLLKGIKND